ncbi:hypothetical protein JTB14_005278 [Gonioctena quinquepunctata]|nr:hypothetical protein JTB14_005278 [Gonioctena quinquepunctata]
MSKYKKPLTEEELLHCLENDEELDVPLLSDEDDIEDENSVHDDDIFAALNAEDDSQNIDDVENMELDETHVEGPNENGTEPEEVGVTLKQEIEEFQNEYGLTEKSKIKWMNNVVYETRNINWYEPPPLDPVIEMPPPINSFMKYIPEEIMQQMVDMTNLFSIQKNIPRFCPTELEEIKKLIGVHIAIDNLQFPRVGMYWSPKYGIPLIKDSISLHRFFKLRQAVSQVDITGRPENNRQIMESLGHI